MRAREPPSTKQGRYQARCRASGRCPHCGKPCAPYAECELVRQRKRVTRALGRMVKAGIVERIGRTYRAVPGTEHVQLRFVAFGGPNDFRRLPRRGVIPWSRLCADVVLEHGRPMRTTEVRAIMAAGPLSVNRSKPDTHRVGTALGQAITDPRYGIRRVGRGVYAPASLTPTATSSQPTSAPRQPVLRAAGSSSFERVACR